MANYRGNRRRRSMKWPALATALVMVIALGAFASVKLLGNRYEDSVKRQDLLGTAGQGGFAEPPKVSGPLTFLLIGSDSREGANANPDTPDGNSAAISGQRSDTIMLVHVPKSTDRAYVVSVPRDTYVPIVDKDGTLDREAKINSAFSRGGAPRLVKTLNNFTGGKIDYPIIVDFAAIRTLTDLVGGVDVVVGKTAVDGYRFMPENTSHPTTPCEDDQGGERRCLTFNAGLLHLDGELAEYYVRQRLGLPSGDFDRVKRQQQYLRALMTKITDGGMLTNPLKFDKFVRAAAGALTVDNTMPVQSLAFSLRDLSPSKLAFMTLPIADLTKVPEIGSVMIPDEAQCQELFAALKADTMDQYVLKYPPNDVTRGR